MSTRRDFIKRLAAGVAALAGLSAIPDEPTISIDDLAYSTIRADKITFGTIYTREAGASSGTPYPNEHLLKAARVHARLSLEA